MIKQIFIIISASIVLGLTSNALNPAGVLISTTRPNVVYADDALLESKGESMVGELQDDTLDEPIIINKTQLKTLLSTDSAILIDARIPPEYDQGHLPDAINIPFEQVGMHYATMDTLPKEKWVVTYCDGPPCDLGELLAFELFSMGFPNVAIYHDGIDDWVQTEDLVHEE